MSGTRGFLSMLWLATTGLSSGCAVDANANPAERCDDYARCPTGLACYRGYCIEEDDASARVPNDDGGHGDGSGETASPARDAAILPPTTATQPTPAPPQTAQPAPPQTAQPAPSPSPEPQKPAQPAPQPEPPKPATPAPQPEAPPEEPAPQDEPNPAPAAPPEWVEPLCRTLCEVLGECSCTGQGEWPSAPACGGDKTRCGEKCVNLRSDKKHCGSCDRECERGQCEAGTCRAR